MRTVGCPWMQGVWCGGLWWRSNTERANEQYCCRQCSKACGLALAELQVEDTEASAEQAAQLAVI